MSSTAENLQRARQLQDEGRFLAAADLLLAAFRASPHSGEVACELGQVLLAAGDPAGALGFLERARHADPADPAPLRASLEALRLLGREEQAARALVDGLAAGIDPVELALDLVRDAAA
jgi:thioredoxin-like negative regulator of GroEL